MSASASSELIYRGLADGAELTDEKPPTDAASRNSQQKRWKFSMPKFKKFAVIHHQQRPYTKMGSFCYFLTFLESRVLFGGHISPS